MKSLGLGAWGWRLGGKWFGVRWGWVVVALLLMDDTKYLKADNIP